MSQRMPPVQYIITGASGDTPCRYAGSAASPEASVGVSLKWSCMHARKEVLSVFFNAMLKSVPVLSHKSAASKFPDLSSSCGHGPLHAPPM